MNTIKQYNKARRDIESFFSGLNHVHTTLIKSLIGLADPYTGIVENITYRDLAAILTVDPAPGRKDTGTPEKHLIRSYLRTVEKQCGDHFSVSCEQQQLKIKFLNMPTIYAQYFSEITEVCTSETFINTGLYNDFSGVVNTEEYTEVCTDLSTPEDAVKNIFIYKNNNKQTNLNPNKQTHKKNISPDFYPDEPTIAEALGKGMTKVLDLAEIQAFINHNRKHGSQWADFNPVFIKWLERDVILTQKKEEQASQKQNITNTKTGSTSYASTTYQKSSTRGFVSSRSSTIDEIAAHHPGISKGTLWLEL